MNWNLNLGYDYPNTQFKKVQVVHFDSTAGINHPENNQKPS